MPVDPRLPGAAVALATPSPESGVRRHFSLPPAPAVDPERGVDLRAALAEYETAILVKVLEVVDWNQTQAARRLGLQRTTLIDMMRRKGLSRPPVASPREAAG